MSNFPRDLRPAAVDEVPLSADEVAHGMWDGTIYGPRAWMALGDRISTQADVVRGKLWRRVDGAAVLRSRLASSSRCEVSTGVV